MNKVLTLRLVTILLIAASLAAVGCARAPKREPIKDSNLVSESYQAADALLSYTPWLRNQNAPLLAASFVNVNSMENSSALGRIIGEQVAARFAQQGYTVIELKLRENVFVKQNAGEFVLSRDVKALSQKHNAAAVIAGTYAIGRRNVFVNTRLIRAVDGMILAAYDYRLPLGPDTKALVASQ